MDEREMLEKIAQSAQNLKVPDALKPEQVQKQLKNNRQPEYRTKRYRYQALAAAACLCLCFGLGGLVYQNHVKSQAQSGLKEAGTDVSPGENQTDKQTDHTQLADAAGEHTSREDTIENGLGEAQKHTDKNQMESSQMNPAGEKPMKKIGKMYTLASDYGEVYDVLKKEERMQKERQENMKSSAEMEDQTSVIMDMAVADSAAAKTESVREFSSTNLQTEGVDESDVIKTDGRYIYAVHKNNIQIQVLDIQNGMPKKAAVIKPDLNEDTDRICELYVADGRLTVIEQCEKTELKEKHSSVNSGQDHTSPQDTDLQAKKKDALKSASDQVQYIDTQAVTKAVSYDISDPEKPVLQDESIQDGWYQTSRKIGNRLYLVTNQSLSITDHMQRKEAVKEDAIDLWIPAVNGRAVSADCIYLPKEGHEGIMMSSFDLADHHKVLDTKLLIHNRANLYVTKNVVYLYYSEYANEALKTRIARFELDAGGMIQAKAAGTVKGTVQDTFAIYERGSYLQVLTSVTSSDPWENRVYVLDENLDTAGKLTGLAEGERIYAARFTGDIGYFVTYRNTDPLFTVDFSDPQHPKVIGELKVTGFSDYLHFWSDDRMLGIGLETNPDSGEVTGVKLSMFDISDPVNVTEEDKIVIKGAQDCTAMHDYKSVLVDLNKNIIALITESYHNMYKEDFHIFSYKNSRFVSRAVRPLAAGNKDYEESTWRSLFAGDTLYLASEKKVIAFDMQQSFSEIGKLVY